MATTNLVVDYLVIGTATLIWLGPFLFELFGTQWLCSVAEAGAGAVAMLLGAAYVVGICMSRVADRITDRWNDGIRDGVFGEGATPTYHNRLNAIVVQSESASEYLSYRRSIVRISRACAVQFGLGAAAWLAVGLALPGPVGRPAGIAAAATCALMCYVMASAWTLVLRGYFHSIKDMYEHLREEHKEDST